MALPENLDGSLRPFNAAEIAAMQIETYRIEDGEHPTHRREFNSSTISASYFVVGSQYENFVGFMLGGSKTYIDAGVTRLSRLKPQTWPGKPNCAAVRIDQAIGHKFIGDDNTGPFPVPLYERIRVDLTFQECPFDLFPDLEPQESALNETRRYMQVLPSETTSDFITLPGGIMKLVTTAGAAPPGANQPPQVNHNIGVPIPAQIIRRRWLRLPYNAWGANRPLYARVFGNPEAGTQGLIGTINNDPNFLGYSAGQLLLIGVEEEEQLDPVGGRCWNLTYRWLVKPRGHNFFYWYPAGGGVGTGTWCFATNDGNYYTTATLLDGKSVFNAREHQALFRVGA